MTGILIATHGTMASGMLNAVELLAGKQNHVETIGLTHEDSIEDFTDKVRESIERLGKRGDVLVFTDLMGASPYNATVKCVESVKDVHFRVLTGTNLGMLLDVFLKRSADSEITADELVDSAISAGKEGVTELFNEVNKMQHN